MDESIFEGAEEGQMDEAVVRDLYLELMECSPESLSGDQPSRSLVSSVKKHGVIEPIILCHVERQEGMYLISGSRRLKAAYETDTLRIPYRYAGWMNLSQAREQRQHANIHGGRNFRQSLAMVTALPEDLKLKGLAAVAKELGVSQNVVADLLKIELALPQELLTAVMQGRVNEAGAKKLIRMSSDVHEQVVTLLAEGEKINLTAKDIGELLKQRQVAFDFASPNEVKQVVRKMLVLYENGTHEFLSANAAQLVKASSNKIKIGYFQEVE